MPTLLEGIVPMMVAAVLFDLDGVIRHWPAEAQAVIEHDHGLDEGAILKTAFTPHLLTAAITGLISDEDWRGRVADTLVNKYGPKGEAAVEAWAALPSSVDQEVVALVNELRVRVPVGLVTNATTRLEVDLRALGLDRQFDVVVNSARVGSHKPDPAIYRHACAELGYDAAKVMLFDDSPANVEGARRARLDAHPFTGLAAARTTCVGAGILG